MHIVSYDSSRFSSITDALNYQDSLAVVAVFFKVFYIVYLNSI